jgi:hypothetical protein
MIKSLLISKTPLIIKHILSGSISESECQKGVNEAIELIESNVSMNDKFRIVIDAHECNFDTLEAKRIWSLQFKMNQSIQKKTELVAIVGTPTLAFYTEKKWFETTRFKFFEKEQEAEMWLLEKK